MDMNGNADPKHFNSQRAGGRQIAADRVDSGENLTNDQMNQRTALARREQMPPYEFNNKYSENQLKVEGLVVKDRETTRVDEIDGSPGFYTG